MFLSLLTNVLIASLYGGGRLLSALTADMKVDVGAVWGARCGGRGSPEERSPQMAHSRFWDSMIPGLWADIGLRPNGGLTSSELLMACFPDTEELICADGRRGRERTRRYR